MTSPRSPFVNVVGGIFAAFSGFGSLILLSQIIVFRTVFEQPEMQAALSKPLPGMPDYVNFLFAHITLFMGAMLAVNLCLFASAIGLLLRKNWARLGFIAVLVLLIGWNLFGLGLQIMIFSSMGAHLPEGADVHTFKMVMVAMSVGCAVFSLAFCALFAWIIKKLLSTDIVAEFQPGAASR